MTDAEEIAKELERVRPKAVELRNKNSWQLYNRAIYIWVRREKPEIVAEAGVAGGATTYCILKAMEENGKGKLYSFDPGHEHVEDESHIGLEDVKYKDYEPGYFIPDELKHRWNFTKDFFDKAVENGALEEVKGEIDMFFHDSDHSDENINKEFELMKDHVKESGYFLIHDPPTEKVWNEFKLVEGQVEGKLTKKVTKELMTNGTEQWALKVFKRGEN